jgi:hypothetical protein
MPAPRRAARPTTVPSSALPFAPSQTGFDVIEKWRGIACAGIPSVAREHGLGVGWGKAYEGELLLQAPSPGDGTAAVRRPGIERVDRYGDRVLRLQFDAAIPAEKAGSVALFRVGAEGWSAITGSVRLGSDGRTLEFVSDRPLPRGQQLYVLLLEGADSEWVFLFVVPDSDVGGAPAGGGAASHEDAFPTLGRVAPTAFQSPEKCSNLRLDAHRSSAEDGATNEAGIEIGVDG